MSEDKKSTPKPDTPKPDTPKPTIPKPDIPKPNIPKPDIAKTAPVAPPVTSVDTDAPEPAPSPAPSTPGSAGTAPGVTADSPPPAMEKEASSEKAESTETSHPPENESGALVTDLVKRFLGVLIDGIIAWVIAAIVGGVADSWFLQWLIAGLVMLTRDSLPMLDGQSVGKKVMKTKAVKEDGSSLSGDWVTGATRNILLAIPLAWLVECFIMLTRSGNPGEGTRLGDDWAKTKVISCE